ncbi:hypothetical protein IQ07DRAFT_595073 [Pyrenochaeta sp. DS3sAY3a]|nr:hypothetical protein IQ07DRAFT_595073 [Pyrenochaeta sp. DS3sAY3a]
MTRSPSSGASGNFRTPWPPRPAVDLEDRIRNRVERAREKHDVDARRKKKDAKVERHPKKNQNDSKTQQAKQGPIQWIYLSPRLAQRKEINHHHHDGQRVRGSHPGIRRFLFAKGIYRASQCLISSIPGAKTRNMAALLHMFPLWFISLSRNGKHHYVVCTSALSNEAERSVLLGPWTLVSTLGPKAPCPRGVLADDSISH